MRSPVNKAIAAFSLLLLLMVALPTIGQSQTEPLSAEYKADIATRIMTLLREEYVLPEQAEIAVNEIQRRLDAGEYDQITDLQTFANRLTGTLDIIDDWHLGVNYYAQPIPEDYSYRSPSAAEQARYSRLLASRNYGFEKLERLPGNVGYLELRDFYYETPYSEAVAAAAMSFLQHTDGLLIDLRRNGGGRGESVQLLVSYLVAGRHLIGTTEYRKDGRVEELWTLDSLAGPRYELDKPVYLLVSSRTFSAAEAFAYALQSLGRVTVFGEATIGGAHPTDNMRLDGHLMLRMPIARSVDPRTGSNWQSVGIQPEVVVAADAALDTAYKALLQDLIDSAADSQSVAEKQAVLRRLQGN